MNPLHIAVVTTSRADYGLLQPLLNRLKLDPDFRLSLLATGSHLSAVHGNTVEALYQDGFHAVTVSIPTLTEVSTKDDQATVCEAMAQGLTGFSRWFAQHKPQ